jgi:hypothetical protein
MLAPPAKRRSKNRVNQRAHRERRKNGLRRVQLYLSDRAIEGLLDQMVADKRLADGEANDHSKFERALAALNEAQGRRWAR